MVSCGGISATGPMVTYDAQSVTRIRFQPPSVTFTVPSASVRLSRQLSYGLPVISTVVLIPRVGLYRLDIVIRVGCKTPTHDIILLTNALATLAEAAATVIRS